MAGEPGTPIRRASRSRAAFPLPLLLLTSTIPPARAAGHVPLTRASRATAATAAFLKLVAGLLSLRCDQLRQRELPPGSGTGPQLTALSCR